MISLLTYFFCKISVLRPFKARGVRGHRFGAGLGASLLLCVLGLHAPGAVRAEAVPNLIREALQQHPSVRAQLGMQGAAQAGVAAAQWQYWPTPSIGLERANTSDPAYSGDRAVTTLRLQQPLWTGGRLDGNLRKAEAQVRLIAAELEATRQQLALRVVQAWSEATAAHGKVGAYEHSRAAHLRLLGLVERRTQEGVSAQADIALARTRLDGTEADLAAAQAQRDTALDKLRLLTGRPIVASALDEAAYQRPPAPAEALDELLAAAREQSPLVAKARAQGEAANAEVTLAKAALSPEVYVRAERQYGNFSLPNQSPQNRLFVGVATAFGGGLSSLSNVDAAVARQQAAQDDIQTQHLAVDEQVRSDATVARTADERRVRLEQARLSTAEVTASWERQFLAGRKQWQDLMNAAREQTQNDIQLADTMSSQQLTGWRLAILARGVDALLASASSASPTPPATGGRP